MKLIGLPTVGFDRFIELAWADYALESALLGRNVPAIKAWLSERISGKDAPRKTANLLTNLWLKSYPETQRLRDEALEIAQRIPSDLYVVLHWGMALANFALFRESVAAIGRLLRLQGGFQTREIQDRMMEIYSNQGTIPRSVARIVQSLHQWGMLVGGSGNIYSGLPPRPLQDETLRAWLFAAALNHGSDRHWPIVDVLRLPELFPFDMAENGLNTIRKSSILSVMREGSDREYVAVRHEGIAPTKMLTNG